MQIASAHPDDAPAIAAVHVAAWRVAYDGLFAADDLAALSVAGREAMWRKVMAGGRSDVLVASDAGAVLGFIAFGPSRSDATAATGAEIWALYVLPARWSQGIGRALWQAARQRLRTQACTSIALWVLAHNQRARRFYAAVGLAPQAGMVRDVTLGSVKVQELRYVMPCGAG